MCDMIFWGLQLLKQPSKCTANPPLVVLPLHRAHSTRLEQIVCSRHCCSFSMCFRALSTTTKAGTPWAETQASKAKVEQRWCKRDMGHIGHVGLAI